MLVIKNKYIPLYIITKCTLIGSSLFGLHKITSLNETNLDKHFYDKIKVYTSSSGSSYYK